ncbi:hypothetical protein [Thermococcus sp. JCM 11816]|uniref:hypothetical protein n=1 Tax=Thermococcus sp. (strain JCM 11816 / KS-1) TaxID=1295125 RepID=UPI000B21E84A
MGSGGGGFETLTMLIPVLVEGGGGITTSLIFPAVLWFWAVFYLILHLYGYSKWVLGKL